MSEKLSHIAVIAAVVLFAFAASVPVQGQNQPTYDQSFQEESPIAPETTETPGEPPVVNTPEATPFEIAPTEVAAPAQETPAEIQAPALLAAPTITVWNESALRFGQIGNPQTQINILGNVTDDGQVASLTYRLNGGSAVTVPIGTNNIRLARAGDFNIALNTSALNNGSNSLLIRATDNNGEVREKTVTVNYTRGRTWPQNYVTNWAGASAINDQAQIIDGYWRLVSGGVRPQEVGYDRVIALGDMNWSHNYEVTVPITVHSFHPDPNNPADSGGVGVIIRWQGHQGSGVLPTDWRRIGAYAYYSNRRDGLALRLNGNDPVVQSFPFQLGRTYIFKVRAETVSQGGRYSFKIWEQGQPEPAWSSSAFSSLVNVVDSSGDLLQGSALLVAHRTDATFGNVTINPYTPQPQVLNNKNYLPFINR